MLAPDSRDPRPAYEQIADDLRAAITKGQLQPGDRLPTEREHAGRYGVAIGTYRQALSVLRQEGWLATHKRHGTVVLQHEANPSPEFTALSERLDHIETQVSQLADHVGRLMAGPRSAGLGARVGQIEADIGRIANQLDELTRYVAGDEFRHDPAHPQRGSGQPVGPADHHDEHDGAAPPSPEGRR